MSFVNISSQSVTGWAKSKKKSSFFTYMAICICVCPIRNSFSFVQFSCTLTYILNLIIFFLLFLTKSLDIYPQSFYFVLKKFVFLLLWLGWCGVLCFVSLKCHYFNLFSKAIFTWNAMLDR